MNSKTRSGQRIIHSPIYSPGLSKFHHGLKNHLNQKGVSIEEKYREFKPHCTIEYVNPGEKAQFEGVKPEGAWDIQQVWIWGTLEPYIIPLNNYFQ